MAFEDQVNYIPALMSGAFSSDPGGKEALSITGATSPLYEWISLF